MVGHQDQLTEGAGKVLVQEEKLDSNDVEGFTLKFVTNNLPGVRFEPTHSHEYQSLNLTP